LAKKKMWVHGDRKRFHADNQLNITEKITRKFAHDNE